MATRTKKAQKLFKKIDDPVKTNVIIAGPPNKKIKADYSDKILPLEFNETQTFNNAYLNKNKNNNNTQPVNNLSQDTSLPYSGGWNNIVTQGPVNPSQLFSQKKNDKNFAHNNMVPFFGSYAKQNVDEYATSGILENFTGNIDNYQKKKETGLFFKPVRI